MKFPISLSLPLLRVGRDSTGDVFSPGLLRDLALDFKHRIPITLGVGGPVVGEIVDLVFDEQVLVACVEVNPHASRLVDDGFELAACGVAKRDGEHITCICLQGGALTLEKVK